MVALESEQELGALSSGASNLGSRAAVHRGTKFILGKKNIGMVWRILMFLWPGHAELGLAGGKTVS